MSRAIEKLLESAFITYKNKDYEKCKKYCREVLRMDSTESRAYYLLASVYFVEGEYDKSIKYSELAIKYDPFNDKYKILHSSAKERARVEGLISSQISETNKNVIYEKGNSEMKREKNSTQRAKEYLKRLGYLTTGEFNVAEVSKVESNQKNPGIVEHSEVDLMDSETMLIGVDEVAKKLKEVETLKNRGAYRKKTVILGEPHRHPSTNEEKKRKNKSIEPLFSDESFNENEDPVEELRRYVYNREYLQAFNFFISKLRSLNTSEEINLFLSYILVNAIFFAKRVARDIKPLKIDDKGLKRAVMEIINALEKIEIE